MANEADFLVLTMYHRAASKEDPIFDYLAQNYQKFAKEIGKDNVARYLVSLNNTYIIQLCKKGDLNYKKTAGTGKRGFKRCLLWNFLWESFGSECPHVTCRCHVQPASP